MSTASRKSFQKAILLTIAFVLVLVIANSLVKFASNSARIFRPHLEAGNANLVPIGDNEIPLIREKGAGFWKCDGDISREEPFLSVYDHIELKDNGIFWRVRRDVIHLASGDSVDFVSVTNGYMQPFFKSKTCRDSVTYQVHFIGQVFIAGGDTCYVDRARMSDDPKKSVMPEILKTPQRQQGEVAADTAWDAMADGKALSFEGRRYTRYDTASGALHSFFPHGSTKLVEAVSIQRCSGAVSPERFAKAAIVKDFSRVSVSSRTQQDVQKAIDTYYRAVCAIDLARSITRGGTGNVTISLSVTPQGAVTDPDVSSAKPWNMRLNNELKNELTTWVFPKCASQKAPVKVSFSFNY